MLTLFVALIASALETPAVAAGTGPLREALLLVIGAAMAAAVVAG
jgi:hypothetical protein